MTVMLTKLKSYTIVNRVCSECTWPSWRGAHTCAPLPAGTAAAHASCTATVFVEDLPARTVMQVKGLRHGGAVAACGGRAAECRGARVPRGSPTPPVRVFHPPPPRATADTWHAAQVQVDCVALTN